MLKLQMTSSAWSAAQLSRPARDRSTGTVTPLKLEPGRRGEHAHRADDGEAHRHQRHDDGESRGDPGQIERQAGAAGHHQVPEHPLGEVGGSRRGAQGGGHDEAEDVQHARDERGVDVVAAGGPVGLRRNGMEQQSDRQEDRGDPDGHQDQGDHEAATLSQLHEPGGDHRDRSGSTIPGGPAGAPGASERRRRRRRGDRVRVVPSWRFPQSARHLQEPRFERSLDLLEPVHRDPAFDEDAVDLGDHVARRAGRQGDTQPRRVGADLRPPPRRWRVPRAGRGLDRARSIRPGARATCRPATRRSVPGARRCPGPRWPRRRRSARTSSRRCEDNTTVRPSATSDRIISRMSCMPAGSSPFIGSSRISSSGSPIRQAATPRRWRMPIEYFDTLSSARCKMPDPFEGRPDALARGRLARARRGCCEVLPARSDGRGTGARRRWPRPAPGPCRDAGGPGVPSRDIVPASAWVSPSSTRMSVVFPAPFGTQVAEGASPGDEQLDAVDGDVVPESLGQPVGLDGPLALGGLVVGGVGECVGGHKRPFSDPRRSRSGLAQSNEAVRPSGVGSSESVPQVRRARYRV